MNEKYLHLKLGEAVLSVSGEEQTLERLAIHEALHRLCPTVTATVRSADSNSTSESVRTDVVLADPADCSRAEPAGRTAFFSRVGWSDPELTELVYGAFAPLLAARLSKQGDAIIDGAAVADSTNQVILLVGSGKSSTFYELVERFGFTPVSEDSVRVGSDLFCHGARSSVSIPSASQGSTRARSTAEIDGVWAKWGRIGTIVQMFPGTHDAAASRALDRTDRLSWLSQAVTARAMGFGCWVPSNDTMASRLVAEEYDLRKLEMLVVRMERSIPVLCCSGRLNAFPLQIVRAIG